MLNDKAQVMMLLKEAARRDQLAAAMEILAEYSKARGVPEWPAIRTAIDAMLAAPRAVPEQTEIAHNTALY